MHYFEHNVGEFATVTRFMTPTEIGIYVILRDEYLYNGVPLVYDRITTMFSAEYEDALKRVLARCFVEKDGVFTCEAFDEMLERYAAQAEKNRRNIQKRWEKVRKANENDTNEYNPNTSGTESNTKSYLTKNQEPITNNHIKEKNTKKKVAEKPEEVTEQVWNDFCALRKEKKAPLTQTALTLITNEAGKAGIGLNEALSISCSRGWQSFKADWLKGSRNGSASFAFDPNTVDYNKGLIDNGDGTYSF